MKHAINKSNLPRFLRRIAKQMIEADGECWEATVCQMSADEIELLTGIIVQDPVEIKIEEGDRANG